MGVGSVILGFGLFGAFCVGGGGVVFCFGLWFFFPDGI